MFASSPAFGGNINHHHDTPTMRYELLEHAADVMVRCIGNNIEECFENAAYAMFDQVVDVSRIDDSVERTITITAEDDEDKLYSFLSELLFIMDCESLVFDSFKVTIDGNTVKCVAKGEPLDVRKHHAKTEIKAVTYHMLSVDRHEPSVTVIFDV